MLVKTVKETEESEKNSPYEWQLESGRKGVVNRVLLRDIEQSVQHLAKVLVYR